MRFLLDLCYVVIFAAALPWLVASAWLRGKRRTGWRAKLLGDVPRREGDRFGVWLHAVSVGEVNLLVPLVAEIQRRHPTWECVVSTSTTTGYELATKRFSAQTVFYCPMDFSWAVRAALRRVRPNLVILAELELWPNLIREARCAGARVAVVNGRLSERSFRGYRRIGWFVSRVLRQVDLIAAQHEVYAARFRALGAIAPHVHVTGSIKFDGAQTDRQNPTTQRLAALAGFSDDDIVFLAASTQEPEEALALATYRELVDAHPRLRLVLVPRHAERFDAVAQLLESAGVPFAQRSQLADHGDPRRARVLLVDTIGELGAWWGTARIGFVGGSLTERGGQNMIEPAAYGVATCFGPNTHNFRDVVAALLAADAARVVHDGSELTAFVGGMLERPAEAAALGERARHLVAGQRGATGRTVDLLDGLAEHVRPFSRRAA